MNAANTLKKLGIVEKLGGEITAESKLNEGSTFRFTIPYKIGRAHV